MELLSLYYTLYYTMKKVIRLVALLLLFKCAATGKTHLPAINPGRADSVVFPSGGRVLNYRIAGFTFPPVEHVKKYTIKIAEGICHSDTEFEQHLILSLTSRTNKVVAEMPFWGRDYTWRVESTDKKKKITQSPFYHFATLLNSALDTNYSRLSVRKKADEYKDAFVFLDTSRILYDMSGNAVWYLPDIDRMHIENSRVRDLKMTQQGTITFIIAHEEHGAAYEVDYDGNILWKSSGFYDHELTKLKNGHYMVSGCSTEQLEWRYFSPADSGLYIASSDGDTTLKYTTEKHSKGSFGKLLELDSRGVVVWSWNEADYYKGKDVRNHVESDEISGKDTIEEHQNSFCFDEKNNFLYVSYRNTNSILKVKYPSGEVVAVYDGNLGQGSKSEQEIPTFCWQHSCRLTDDGHICLFNNNRCNKDSLPQILVLDDTVYPDGSFNILWKYDCPMKKKKGDHPNGGNVMQLPDHAFFVSMCAPYSRLFILSEDDKQELWEAHYQKYNKTKGIFEPSAVYYRASIIGNRDELEKLIWNSSPYPHAIMGQPLYSKKTDRLKPPTSLFRRRR